MTGPVGSTDPALVRNRADLAAGLKAVMQRRGVPLRKIEDLARELVGRRRRTRRVGEEVALLPRATVSDFLGTGDLTVPQLRSFLVVCEVSRADFNAWITAWHRVNDPAARATVIGSIPAEADSYQHRAAEEILLSTGRIRSGQFVVSGLGGVGKTQLAAWAARRLIATQAVEVVMWVPASSSSAVIASYARAGRQLAVPGAGESTDEAAAAFRSWLETTTARWIVVLDDLNEAAAIRDLWPPVTRHGRVIVTTRRRDANLLREGRLPVELGVFSADEARAYVDAKLPTELADDVEGVVADLDRHPLALSHAAAYMSDKPVSCSGYLRAFADERRRLVELFPDETAIFEGPALTVATTWSISIKQANDMRPPGVAGPILQLASFLDAAGIPSALFVSEAARGYVNQQLSRDRQPPTGTLADEAAKDGIANLRRLSLLDTGGNTEVVIHSLVQRAVRDALVGDRFDQAAVAAADALFEIWPEVERNPEFAAALRANTIALYRHANDALIREAVHPVLFHVASSLADTGAFTDALAMSNDLYGSTRTRLGPDHRDTLSLRNSLAQIRSQSGDPAGAAREFEGLLDDVRRSLGADHPHALATRMNLAYALGNAGRATEALDVSEALLVDELRILGPDDRLTLATRDYAARWRAAIGDLRGAISATEALLADQIRVLGTDDPATLTSRNNIALWIGETGDVRAAADAFAALLDDRTRILGPDHPHTLTARNGYAYWLGNAGDFQAAAEATELLLQDIGRVLGPEHPNTLATRGNLARWRAESGDIAAALNISEELIPDMTRILGPHHPRTLVARHNRASWLAEAGNFAEAVTELQQLVADRERVLGRDNPQTLHTRSDLARFRAQTGQVEEALDALRKVHADQLRVLDPDHPEVLGTRYHIALVAARAGDRRNAASMLSQLLQDQERNLGSEHPLIAKIRESLKTFSTTEAPSAREDPPGTTPMATSPL